jgi:MATE family multidrug resistance protein
VNVLRDLLRLATPVLISQLAVMANGVVDTLMAGWLSATDLASIGLGTSIYIIAYVSLLSVLMGLSPIAAQHYGAQRYAAIGIAFRQSLLLSLGLGVVGAALLSQTDLWITLSMPPPEVASLVADYLHWCALGVVPALLVRAFSALCTAVSLPRIVMWINLGMLLLKVPLNAALMFGVDALGLEGLGAPGAACSTCMLSFAAAGIALLLALKDRRLEVFGLRGSLRPRRAELRELLAIGLPIGGTAFVDVSAFASIALLVAKFGEVASASQQIASSLTGTVYLFSLALASATMVLTAQRLGAGKLREARAVARTGLRASLAVAALLATALWLSRGMLAAAYTSDIAVRAAAIPLIGLLAVYQALDSLQLQYAFVLRAHKRTSLAFWIYVGSLWGIGLGGGSWLTFHAFAGLISDAQAFWWAGIAACVVASVALGVLCARTWQEAAAAREQHSRSFV